MHFQSILSPFHFNQFCFEALANLASDLGGQTFNVFMWRNSWTKCTLWSLNTNTPWVVPIMIGDGWANAVNPGLVRDQSPSLLKNSRQSDATTKRPGFILAGRSIIIASWSSNIWYGGSPITRQTSAVVQYQHWNDGSSFWWYRPWI